MYFRRNLIRLERCNIWILEVKNGYKFIKKTNVLRAYFIPI